jgi:hypothetical protein
VEPHVRVLGVLNILAGAIGAIAGMIFFGLSAGPAAAAAYGPIIGYMIIGVVSLALMLAVPMIVIGIGLLKFRPWARSVGTVVAIIEILSFPLGTLLGAYSLWVLMSSDTDPLFSPRFGQRAKI